MRKAHLPERERNYSFGIAKIRKNMEEQKQKFIEGLDEAARLFAIPHYMKDIDKEHLEEYPYDKMV